MNANYVSDTVVSGDALLRLRTALQCSQQEFAGKLQISRSHLSKLEKGHLAVSRKIVIRYQKLAERESCADHASKVRTVPVRSMAEAGAGIDYEELPFDWQRVVPTDCPDAEAFAVEVNGDSMEPKYYKGDLVVLMPGSTPCNGTLVVARLENEGVVFKLFSKRGNEVTLTSYNAAHPPIMVDAASVHWVFPVWQVVRNVGNRTL